MPINISEYIRQMREERNISEEQILKTIESTLLSAYRSKIGIDNNAIVRFSGLEEVAIYAKKKIVEKKEGVFFNEDEEIDIGDARELNPNAEMDDEILIEIDPRKEFDRASVQSAKITANQSWRAIQRTSLLSEYKEKIGEIIIGYYQREKNGNIYVDLGKIEGVLPRKNQSPRESYRVNDRIKALIQEVEKTKTQGIQVVLSRTHTDFVKAIFELEVPEIYDKTVEIHKIVREPGYRTKLAVYSNRDDVDPVGACVGLKGSRIQAVIKELEGEKIDILKYDPNPRSFIKNALSPAEVRDVVILDEAKHQALAVVNDSQLSLAIGKQGLNVRLANRLVDWNIDVKTEAQFEKMDINDESRKAVDRLFGGEDYENDFSMISDLPGVDQKTVEILRDAGIEYIEDYIDLSREQLDAIEGLSAGQIEALNEFIKENVEILEENEDVSAEKEEEADSGSAWTPDEMEAEEYKCPICGAKITIDAADTIKCPNCGTGLTIKDADEIDEDAEESGEDTDESGEGAE